MKVTIKFQFQNGSINRGMLGLRYLPSSSFNSKMVRLIEESDFTYFSFHLAGFNSKMVRLIVS